MKQLYTTGPLAPAAAPELAAASPGVRPEDLQAALPLTAYTPPPRGDAPGPLPVRLALLNAPGAGRVLAHVAPNGSTYFAHALLDIPATADAQMAIQTWGSPMWQREAPPAAGDLPELPYLPVTDVLDDAAVKTWLTTPARREMLEFVLAALLTTPASAPITLAATADDVARVVYAVTRVLPHNLLDGLTFSTYEPDPLACNARIVGHDTGSAEADLPDACYTRGAALNPATGRRTAPAAPVPFAAFAAHALADGNLTVLDQFLGVWQRLGMTDARQFELVYRLARETTSLGKDECAAALLHPPLAAWVSSRPDAVKQFLDWALDDTVFATQAFARVVQTLRQKPDVVAKLAEGVRQSGFAAVKAGDRTRAVNALEVILPMVAPGKANVVWADVLGLVADPNTLTWEMRWYLLPRFIRFRPASGGGPTGVDPALAPWLDVPADRLGELLGLDVPRAYHLAAARAGLARADEPTPTYARAVAAQPKLVLTLLQPGEGIPEDRAARLFDLLIEEAPKHAWFEDVLANASSFPAARRNRFFESVLAAGKVDADHLIRAQATALLDLFAGQSGLDRLGRQFMAAPPDDVFTDPKLLEFLDKLRGEPQVGDDVKGRIAAVQAVRSFLDRPDFHPEPLQAVAAALAVQPAVVPELARTQVRDAVATELARRADAPDFQRHLEAALIHAGAALSDSPAGLYRELLRRHQARKEFGKAAKPAQTFLAVALGATVTEEAAGQLDGLEAEAFAVATAIAKQGGKRVLAEVDARSAEWPKSARTQWGFLIEAVRPKGSRVPRDILMFAIGAAAASAGWFIMQWVK